MVRDSHHHMLPVAAVTNRGGPHRLPVATPSAPSCLFPFWGFDSQRFVHYAFVVLQFKGLFFSHGDDLTQYHPPSSSLLELD